MASILRKAAATAALVALAACGGSSTGPAPANHSVTISWQANHEKGVNGPGGGYRVLVTGRPQVDLPYVSGAFAPTSLTTVLFTGNYGVTVTAYQPTVAGSGTTLSAPATMTVIVP